MSTQDPRIEALDTAEEWAKMLGEAAAIAVKPIGAVADSPKPAPHDAFRAWEVARAMVEQEAQAALPVDPLEARRDALIVRLLAAGFVEAPGPTDILRRFDDADGAVLIPVGHPCEVERDFENTLNHAEKQCVKVEAKRARRSAPDSREIPTDAHPVIATLDTILTLKAQMQRERAEAKAEIDRLTAALDYERQQANEALAQLHDAKAHKEAVRRALLAALGMDPDEARGTAWLLSTIRAQLATLKEDFGKAQEENEEAAHLLMLLGIKPGTLPDMITALLPPDRLLLLRVRNESSARLALDNLALQGVPETDPRRVEAVKHYREAVALRMAAEPVRDHSPDAGKMVEAE